MTFLILLVSIAVLEYVMRRPEPPPERSQPPEKEVFKAAESDELVTLAPSLGQLGRALEQFGRGVTPQAGEGVKEEKKV